MKKTKQTEPDKIREYNILGRQKINLAENKTIQDDFIKACQVKRSITADEDFKRTLIVTVVLILIGSFFCFLMIDAQIKLSRKSEVKTVILPTISVTMPTFPGKGQPVITSKPTNTIGGGFKSYMDYRKITNKESDQFALQKIATTDTAGFRRVGRYFCIAMGTHYAQYIGQTFIVELENENIDCIVADIKDDKDTLDGTYCKENGSIIEFVIDKEKLSEKMLVSGNILKYKGEILSIESECD